MDDALVSSYGSSPIPDLSVFYELLPIFGVITGLAENPQACLWDERVPRV